MLLLTVSIIIHNDFSHIYHTLETLKRNTETTYLLYITINAGSEAEILRLQVVAPQAIYIINHYPLGFATNHNHIMRIATTSYVLLLNDDVEIHKGAIDKLVQYLDRHSDVGLVGPYIKSADESPQLSVFSDPSLMRMLYSISGLNILTKPNGVVRRLIVKCGLASILKTASLDTRPITRTVPVVVGVAMLARRQAYLEAGMMDEDVRVYGEEYGWHLRLRSSGWKVAFVAESEVTHFNNQSSYIGWKLIEHRKSILNYFLIYKPKWQICILRIGIFFFSIFYCCIWFPFNRQRSKNYWDIAILGLTWDRSK